LVGAFLFTATVARAQERVTLGGRETFVWRPASSGARRVPIVVFSHGFGGCATQSRFLTQALAARGYFVVAPNHKDATCGRRGAVAPPEEAFGKPGRWTAATFIGRRDDVRAVLAALRDSTQLRGRLDFERVGLAGHSLGGYTVVGLAGGWSSWKLDGVKAVLALSPYVEPFLAHHTLGSVAVPVMYQGGTVDFGITPSVKRPRGAYDETPAPKYFVDLSGAGHMAWTNVRAAAHETILNYAIPFFDRYVRNEKAADRLTVKAAGVALLRFDTSAVRR